MPRRGLAALAGALLGLLVACGQPVVTVDPVYHRIQATGSTTLSPLITELATAFHELAPSVSLTVDGAGTGYGLEALRIGEADLALASWLPADLDPSWQATPIARDGIAVIVHPDNPIEGLGLLQLQDLFSGRVYEWEAVGAPAAQGIVQPVSREEGSGTRAAFETLAMDGHSVTLRAVVATSSQAVVDYVADHRQAIGYVSIGYLSTAVKALTVEGESPTPEAAQQGSYPLSRELWLVTLDPPPPAVQQFLDFAQSPAGQAIVSKRYARTN
ncbi:MAG: phosphate ABC transporter substrate-binding protein [Anaerolineae bacterium]|nr:phosphate ABC transporter substrate-binding protein [Anaerolineae bacterium]